MARPDVYQRTLIDVLSPEFKKQLKEHHRLKAFEICGCTRSDGFEGQGVIPLADMERVSVFRTDEQKGTYNHHSCLTKWQGKYRFAWDNCLVHEEYPGQTTLISSSDDARSWTEPTVVACGDAEAGMLRNIGALYPTESKLYAFIQEKWDLARATNPAASRQDSAPPVSAPPGLAQGGWAVQLRADHHAKVPYRFNLHETEDGVNWRIASEGHFDVIWTLEAPRLTKEGRLLGPATTHDSRPAVLLWPGSDPAEKPQVITIPYAVDANDYYAGHDEGLFFYGEATWYQDDDERIWMWHRDESGSCCLGVALSEDGGRTWTEVMRSNFPDSMARVFAGRLNDGRFFIVGNSTYQHMDRNFFTVSISPHGTKFDKMYQLVHEPTRQRFAGHLKGHGYQYPSCLVEGDTLFIGYSVNKEDIEVGILDTTKL